MNTSRNKIFGALLLGLGLVSIAFIANKYVPYISSTSNNGTSVVITKQRQYISTKDEDNNSIPDWRDSLLDTEPLRIEKSTSTYKSPETLTGRFGIKFFKEIANLQLEGKFKEKKGDFITAAVGALVQETKDTLYTKKDIETIASNDTEVLRSYGELIALIIVTHPVSSENELDILEDARDTNNPDRLNDLVPIIDAYADMIKQMLDVSVPEAYQKEHVDLLNTYNAMLQNIKALQNAFEDPLYSYLRLKRYDDDVLGMTNALIQLYSALYLKDGVRWKDDSAVLQVIQFNEKNEQ